MVTVAPASSSLLSTTLCPLSCSSAGPRESSRWHLGSNLRQCLTAPCLHCSLVHLHNHGRHLFRCVKGAWVRVGLHLLYYDSPADGLSATTIIVNESVAVHLTLYSAACIICPPTRQGSTHFSSVPNPVHEQRYGNLAFWPCPATGFPCLHQWQTIEKQRGYIRKRKTFWKNQLHCVIKKFKKWTIFVRHQYRISAPGFPLNTNITILMKVSNSDSFSPALIPTLISFLKSLSVRTYFRHFVIFRQSSVSSAKCLFLFEMHLQYIKTAPFLKHRV